MYSQKTRYFAVISLMIAAVFAFSFTAAARGGDGTGPDGRGPKTGRAAGYCAGYSVPGYQNTAVPRLGLGRSTSRGGGRGNRNIYTATGLTRWQRESAATSTDTVHPALSKEQQLETLKKQADYLKNELEKISGQIEEIESKD